jgi:hypothetical protein
VIELKSRCKIVTHDRFRNHDRFKEPHCPDHASGQFFWPPRSVKTDGRVKEGLPARAAGGADLLQLFRIPSESLDRRSLSDIPFRRIRDTHCRRKGRSLCNARKE